MCGKPSLSRGYNLIKSNSSIAVNMADDEERLRALEKGRKLLKSRTRKRASKAGNKDGDGADSDSLSITSSTSETESREGSPPLTTVRCVLLNWRLGNDLRKPQILCVGKTLKLPLDVGKNWEGEKWNE